MRWSPVRQNNFAAGVMGEAHVFGISDISANPIVSRTEIDRSGKKRELIVEYPDSATSEVSVIGNGRLLRITSAQNVTSRTHYDSFGRIVKNNDRTGDHLINYHSGTTYPSELLDRGQPIRRFHYDGGGRLSHEERLTDTAPSLIYVNVYNQYGRRGLLTRQWGDGAMPIRNIYDDYGQRTEMHTFKDLNNQNDWNLPSWPPVRSLFLTMRPKES